MTDGFALAVAGGVNKNHPKHEPFSIKDIVGDGFLWAVPRCRRTLEKRLTRKFGLPNGFPHGVVKMIQRKTTLRTCNVCGDDHEVGVLCRKDAMKKVKGVQNGHKENFKLYSGKSDKLSPQLSNLTDT